MESRSPYGLRLQVTHCYLVEERREQPHRDARPRPPLHRREPRETSELTHAALDGDWKRARELHYKLYPMARAAFMETNPIPIKEAMAMAGMLEPEFRLPMCRMGEANRERLRGILRPYGLVKQ